MTRALGHWGWALAPWALAAISYVYGWANPNTHCAFLCEMNLPALALVIIGAVAMLLVSFGAALTSRWWMLLVSLASAPVLAWVGWVAFLGGAR